MHPPKLPLKFLRWFCSHEQIEEVEGDLIEVFETQYANSKRRAEWKFVWNVMRSFRPLNIKRSKTQTLYTAMFRNHFKIGFRNLVKDFKFTIINMVGMAIGLAVFLLMILIVHHEMTYDEFHKKSDRIFEVVQVFQTPDGNEPEIWTSLNLSEALRNEMSMVENAVSIHGAASTWVEADSKNFFEEEGIVAGSQFFEIFDFELLVGNPEVALDQKNSIVISKTLANKYFAKTDVIGNQIDIDRYGQFTITGVLKDLPTNSFIQFDFVLTQDYDVFFTKVAPWFVPYFQSWRGDPAATFVLLRDPSDAAQFNNLLHPIMAQNVGEENVNKHHLVNMRDLHFGSNGIDGQINKYVKGDIEKIRLLVVIATIVLIMACFNYINVTTARAVNRAKEVGIKKAIGAHRAQLTAQFLIESFVLVCISFVLALGLGFYFLPSVVQITGIGIDSFWNGLILVSPFVIILMILITLISGYYPAFHLSKLSTINALSGGKTGAKNQLKFRNGLVTFQFVMVIILTSALLIVNDQYQYLNNKSLGFNPEELVVVEINGGGVRQNFEKIKNELNGHSAIRGVTGLTRMISGYRTGVPIDFAMNDRPDELRSMQFYGMDENGLSTLGIELVSGKDFQGIENLDSASVLLNETAAAPLGGTEVIGKYVLLGNDEDDQQRSKVVGIVRDFHYASMHEPIGSVVIGYYLNPFESLDDIVIKIDGNRRQEALAQIETVHHRYDENDMMTWEFMDDMVQRSYQDELVFRNLFSAVSILAIVIAILGVVGLTSFTALARTKEFGIRKVLGADLANLLFLQSSKLGLVVFGAAIIALPIIIWFGNGWLENYAYSISLSPITFGIVVLGLLFLVALVVGVVGYRVAKQNPVESLKWE